MALAVIGAGFGRTGTSSLRDALNALGLGPCHHMRELISQAAKVDPWLHAARGEVADWEAAFDGYRSATDWPSCDYYRELSEYYPDAKFILTTRDPAAWYASITQTIFSEVNVVYHKDPGPLGEVMRALVSRNFNGRIDDREACIAAFNRHSAEVKAAIQPSRLLVYNVAEGWAPLCAFLDRPIPDALFPVSNTKESWLASAPQRLAARMGATGPKA